MIGQLEIRGVEWAFVRSGTVLLKVCVYVRDNVFYHKVEGGWRLSNI